MEFDGSKFQLAAAEPNPKHGGVLRVGIPLRPPHFDVHQSGTIFNLGSQGCMFDNLLRRDPRDGGQTIIPDLAHSWEIAKDGKTYTFFLRKDVLFHDGAELTADHPLVRAGTPLFFRKPEQRPEAMRGQGVSLQSQQILAKPGQSLDTAAARIAENVREKGAVLAEAYNGAVEGRIGKIVHKPGTRPECCFIPGTPSRTKPAPTNVAHVSSQTAPGSG
jgi:hypothetical protein